MTEIETRKDDPNLRDFYHDMNIHGTAIYKRIGGKFVIELDTLPGDGWQITVWEAVQRRRVYVHPDGDNRYAWDAVGREEFYEDDAGTAESAARSRFALLTAVGDVRTFCKRHPYNGPRSPWSES